MLLMHSTQSSPRASYDCIMVLCGFCLRYGPAKVVQWWRGTMNEGRGAHARFTWLASQKDRKTVRVSKLETTNKRSGSGRSQRDSCRLQATLQMQLSQCLACGRPRDAQGSAGARWDRSFWTSAAECKGSVGVSGDEALQDARRNGRGGAERASHRGFSD